MDRSTVVAKLHACESELKAAGGGACLFEDEDGSLRDIADAGGIRP
jgi:hypothetical protein